MRATAWRYVVLVIVCATWPLITPGSSLGAEPGPNGVPGNWHLVLNEEFSGGLNQSIWTPGWQHSGVSGPMNGSCVSSSSSNVSQPSNGYLYLDLTAAKNECSWEGQNANSNTGALVESNPDDGLTGHGGFSYLYGDVEWRIWIPGVDPKGVECPKGGCLPDFPALWGLPVSHASEIDTMEGLGTKGQACFHLPPPFGQSAPGACTSGGYAGAWHTFDAEWEPGLVTYYYDGARVGQLSSKYIAEPQYLVMDMVNPINGQPDIIPNTLTIDYARVWQREPPNSRNIFYVGTNNKMQQWFIENGKWQSFAPGGSAIKAESSPATVYDPATGRNVFYVGENGAINDLYIENGGWQNYQSGWHAKAGTSPSAVYEAGSGRNIFYVGEEGSINDLYVENNKWSNAKLGGHVKAGTSPSAVVAYGSGRNVFYIGENGAVYDFAVENGSWQSYEIGGHAKAGTSPSAVVEADGSGRNAFYVGENGAIYNLYVENGSWQSYEIGGTDQIGSPSAVVEEGGSGRNVFFIGEASQIDDLYVENGKWKDYGIGGVHVKAGTSPSAVFESGSGRNVFYIGENATVNDLYVGNGSWDTYQLGGAVASGTSPSAMVTLE